MRAVLKPLFVVLACLALTPAATAADEIVEYLNGHWFDGDSFEPGRWYAIDGRLSRSAPRSADRVHDLRGGYVLPPLAEAHNHNLQNAWGVRNHRERYLAEGVQYAAMLCGDPASTQAAQAALEQSPIDVLFASACISSSDGHPLAMARRNPDGSLIPVEQVHDRDYIVMDSLADIDAKWPLVREARTDLIKVVLVHSEREQRRDDPRYYGRNGLKPALLAPLVRKAHEQGLRVAVHVESASDFRVAVEAGVDFIAHLPGYQIWDGHDERDYRLDDDAIAAAARRGIAVVATANAAEALARDPQTLARVRALQQDNLRRLLAAGVPVAIGSDRYDGTARNEIEYLAALQVMTTAQLLHAAVDTTPRLLFPQRRIGRIAEGYEASFLVLEADPLSDVAALRRIVWKLRRGHAY